MKNAEEIALHFKDEVLRRHPTMSSNLGIKDYKVVYSGAILLCGS